MNKKTSFKILLKRKTLTNENMREKREMKVVVVTKGQLRSSAVCLNMRATT